MIVEHYSLIHPLQQIANIDKNHVQGFSYFLKFNLSMASHIAPFIVNHPPKSKLYKFLIPVIVNFYCRRRIFMFIAK
jgi:hypothetical protein